MIESNKQWPLMAIYCQTIGVVPWQLLQNGTDPFVNGTGIDRSVVTDLQGGGE